MAIKDIQQQLIKSEGQSGEFLFKKIEADLTTIYNRGYGDERTPLLDSYWKEAFEEFKDEGKRAVRKGKSKEAEEVLKDLETFQKSLEATAEISSSGIGAGTMAMLLAVKPHIKTRVKTLKKNEGIFKSMKKKAISSAFGAVESFASSFLAPLPFGAGEAIIEKTKGFFGGGKGDKAERQAEQAVSFAGRIEREGPGTGGSSWEDNGAAENGGVVTGGGKGGGLGETNDILRDILDALKPDRETAREEEREDDREHKETIDAMNAGGVGVAAGEDEDGGTTIIPIAGLGKFLPAAGALVAMAGVIGSIITAAIAAAWFMATSKLGETAKEEGDKRAKEIKDAIPIPVVSDILGEIGGAQKTADVTKQGLMAVVGGVLSKQLTLAQGLQLLFSGSTSHAEGITDVNKDHLAMIHEGEVVLDNKAALDFKEGAKVLGGIRSHAKGFAGPLDDEEVPGGIKEMTPVNWPGKSKSTLETLTYLKEQFGVEMMPVQGMMGKSAEFYKKQGLKGTMYMPSIHQDAIDNLAYTGKEVDVWKQDPGERISKRPGQRGYRDLETGEWFAGFYKEDQLSKWAKGLDSLFENYSMVGSQMAFHRLAGIQNVMEQVTGLKKVDKSGQDISALYTKFNNPEMAGGMTKQEEGLWEVMHELGLDWMSGKTTLAKTMEGGKFYPGLGRMKKVENPLYGVSQAMQSLSLSQMSQFQESIKMYLLVREALQIAQGEVEAKFSVWGASDIVSGPDKDIFRTDFGKNYAMTQNLLAKGTGLGMVERLKPILAEASVEIQNLVGGKVFYKPTTEFLSDPRNLLMDKTRDSISGKYGMGVAEGGLGLLHKGEEVIEAPEVRAIGKALNNAAFDRVGLNGQGNVINAPTFNAPTSVTNNTIKPRKVISPEFPGKVGEGDKLYS